MASPVRIDPKLARWLARESRRLTRLRKRPVSRVEVSRELGGALQSLELESALHYLGPTSSIRSEEAE